MDILSLILEIRFTARTPLVTEDKRQKLVEVIVGQTPKDKPPDLLSGMQLNHKLTKTRVVTEENRIAISVEYPEITKAKNRLVEILEIAYGEINYVENSISRIGVRTQWIYTWSGNFSSLITHYKENFYTDNSLIKDASDVGVALTLIDKGYKVNYSTGPMKPKQGQQFLVFKDRELPHDFIFIDVDRYADENQPRNDLKIIGQFISESIEYGKNKAEGTVNILSGENK